MQNRTLALDPASSAAATSTAHGDQVMARARALEQAARTGSQPVPLKGKYLGLISEQPESPAALLFIAAANDLGAQVAQIKPSVARLGASDDIELAALWMGRLYDAIECQGLEAAIVRRIRAAAGVPVLDGLACKIDRNAAWLREPGGNTADEDGHRFLLQALLLDVLS